VEGEKGENQVASGESGMNVDASGEKPSAESEQYEGEHNATGTAGTAGSNAAAGNNAAAPTFVQGTQLPNLTFQGTTPQYPHNVPITPNYFPTTPSPSSSSPLRIGVIFAGDNSISAGIINLKLKNSFESRFDMI
jgi:hypothetical protein